MKSCINIQSTADSPSCLRKAALICQNEASQNYIANLGETEIEAFILGSFIAKIAFATQSGWPLAANTLITLINCLHHCITSAARCA